MRALALAVLLLPGAIAAQVFTLPTPPVVAANNNLPFAGGFAHYQQWYSANEIIASLGPAAQPVRFQRVDFLAGSGQQTATTLDLEVAMGPSFISGLGGSFAANFTSPPVTVVPRRTINLVTGPTGSVVIALPFANLYTWDGTSAVVVDIKVFGNGQANQPFPYDFQSTTTSFGKTTRAYALGNTNATFATSVQSGWGLYTRFTVRPGAMLPFGTGCPGEGFIVPEASVSPLASPGIPWVHEVSRASSQRLAMWVIGDSRTQWGPNPLPLDLGQAIGAAGCLLLTNPVATQFTMTVGGGAGAGLGTLTVQLPPTTVYVGLSVYTQWFVDDPFAINGLMSATAGIWTIVAPVGG